MDTLSHGLWGGLLMKAMRRPAVYWGAFWGAAPDLFFFIPSKIEQILERGWAGLRIGSEPGIWRADGPPLPPELVEAYHRYYVWTHSLVVLLPVVGLVMLGRRRWGLFGIPYALHILMDLPTHERYLTQPFYPLSGWTMQGLTWTDPRILVLNWAGLLALWLWVRSRKDTRSA